MQILLVFIFLLWMNADLYAQQPDENKDSVVAGKKELVLNADSTLISTADSTLINNTDSAKINNKTDTTKKENTVESKEQELGIKIAKDALPSVVNTTAKDSAVLNVKDKIFYLYGDAKANYEDLEIKSGVLVFHQKTNMLSAIPILDTAGKKISVQEFKQGDQTFTYDTLKYNFQSKRAIVRNAHSQYGDGYVISQQIKRNADGSIFGFKSIYTTCSLDHPHFGIQARKIKVIPNKVIASGPANLEIMDIPTPLFFPFGMFPIKDGQHSGFILPTYNIDQYKGIGLQNLGYYFAINDYLGYTTQVSFFSKGSWASANNIQYANRYHYNGNLQFSYSYTVAGGATIAETSRDESKDFNFSWQHNVDPKATPNTTFGASVNFGTSSYNRINQVDYLNKVNNTYQSSISYGKTWQDKPYSLTIAARHNQNTNTNDLTVVLPTINFNLGQFSPFQRKVMIGNPRWYEKITVNYSVTGINEYNTNTTDTGYKKNPLTLANMDNAIQHTASISATYNVLRFFNWSISLPYTEYWNTKQLYLYPQTDKTVDSVRKTGFFAARSTSISTSLSTRVYGMLLFKKGKVAGLRHVLTPSIGLSYVPGYSSSPFNNSYANYDYTGRPVYNNSPYQFSPLGAPPSTPDPSGNINFSLGNTLQMKVRSTDTSGNASSKNVNLIDNLSFSGSYNMFADSNNLSNINMSFSTNILNKVNISANALFSPYVYVGGRPTKQYLLSAGRGLAQVNSAGFSFSMNFRGDKKNEKEQADAQNKNDEVNRLLSNGGYNNYYDFNIPWNIDISGGLNMGRSYNSAVGATDYTIKWAPSMVVRGGFNLTERWKVSADFPLQFEEFKKVTIAGANINISRDLHCWQMSLNLIPFGPYQSFNFLLQVKSTMLQDLKLTRKTTVSPLSY